MLPKMTDDRWTVTQNRALSAIVSIRSAKNQTLTVERFLLTSTVNEELFCVTVHSLRLRTAF